MRCRWQNLTSIQVCILQHRHEWHVCTDWLIDWYCSYLIAVFKFIGYVMFEWIENFMTGDFARVPYELLATWYCVIVLVLLTASYKGCLESIRPFWISGELVAWPWCNLAASQRRPYCPFVNSHSPVGLVSWQWDAVDWAWYCMTITFTNLPFNGDFSFGRSQKSQGAKSGL